MKITIIIIIIISTVPTDPDRCLSLNEIIREQETIEQSLMKTPSLYNR